ncbi:MAG: redoxin family protein, partial [Planctomycetota bacterium]
MNLLKSFTVFLFTAVAIVAAPPRYPELALGADAPNFSLPGVDGKMHTLADYKDADVLAILFTCNHCPTAQAYEQRIIKLVKDYKDTSFQFVAISPNDDKAVRPDELGYSDVGDSLKDMQLRAKEKSFNFPYLYDGDTQATAKLYGPRATPHLFVFDRERKLRYVGRIDNNEKGDKVTSHDARNAIEQLLAGKTVEVAKTRAFGCSTKWASKRGGVAVADEKWAQQPVTLEDVDAAGIKKLVKNDTDKLLLINLWATWCGPCVAEFPDLVMTNRFYRRRDFQMVTISLDRPSIKTKVHDFL